VDSNDQAPLPVGGVADRLAIGNSAGVVSRALGLRRPSSDVNLNQARLMNPSESPKRPNVSTELAATTVIIPARNEEKSIGLVLKDLPDVSQVIVVDNGSTDATASIAAAAGCMVVYEPIAGYGRACLAGMSALDAMTTESDAEIRYVAFIDADYSDHPEELIAMLSMLGEDQADFVLGSRMQGNRQRGAMPLQAVLGNRLACGLMRLIWGTSYTDLGPFRVIRYDKLMRLGMQDLDFGWTIEMQIKAELAGLRTVEIPAAYRRRVGVSKISGTVVGTIRAGHKILYTIAKYALKTRLSCRKTMSDSVSRVHAHKPA
jgi:glycosyltransferase involved in cell wall biosynthesis